MNLIDALAEGVGPRTAGSDAASRASETVADAFRALGLEPRFQEFDLLGYDADEPELEVEGERWAAGPCMYAHDVRRCRHGAQDRRAVGSCRRRAARRVRGRRRRRSRGGADSDEPVLDGGDPFHVAARADHDAAVGIRLRRATRHVSKDGMRVRLKVGGRFLPGRTERNVIADIPGRGDGHVIVSAHFDSVWRGPGAIDNASGVEGVRRIGEALARRDLDRSVRLIAFAAEEIKLTGSRYYVDEARLRGQLDEIVGMVNLDCIAHGEKLNVLASPETMLDRATVIARETGLLERYELVTRARDRWRRHALVRRERDPRGDDPAFPVRPVPPDDRYAGARRRPAARRRGCARARADGIASHESDRPIDTPFDRYLRSGPARSLLTCRHYETLRPSPTASGRWWS